MSMQEKNNYYEVLEVETDSTLQDIRSAYTRAKNAYSTDSVALYSLMSPEECSEVLQQIEEAYSILGAADKRREYDMARGLNQAHTPEGFHEEIMSRVDYAPQKSLTKEPTPDREFEQVLQEKAQKEEFQYQQEHSLKNRATVSKVQAYKKFGLAYEQNVDFEQEIENSNNFTGEFLKRIRDYKHVTVERMAEMTRISKTYIRSIEDDDFSKLPADVYTRGFVYQYAKCLKLNPDLVATSYINHLRQLKNPTT